MHISDGRDTMNCYRETKDPQQRRRECAADPFHVKVLKEFSEAGIVTLVQWPHKALCDSSPKEVAWHVGCDIPTMCQVNYPVALIAL